MGFELLAIAIMVTMLGAQHALQRAQPRRSARTWDAAWARVFERWGQPTGHGTVVVGGTTVHVDRIDHPTAPRRHVRILGGSGLPSGLALSGHRGPAPVRAALFGAHDVTGDAGFDARYVLRAAASIEAVAALRPAARDRWAALPEVGLSVDDGMIHGVDAPVHSPWTPDDGAAISAVAAAIREMPDGLPAKARVEIMALVDTAPMRARAERALACGTLADADVHARGVGDGRGASFGHEAEGCEASIRMRMHELLAEPGLDADAVCAGFVEGSTCPPALRAELAAEAVREPRWGVEAVRRAWRTADADLADAVFAHAPATWDPDDWPVPPSGALDALIDAAQRVGTPAARRWLEAMTRSLPVDGARGAVDAIASRRSVDAVVTLRRITGDARVAPAVRRHADRHLGSVVRQLGASSGRIAVAGSGHAGDLAVRET